MSNKARKKLFLRILVVALIAFTAIALSSCGVDDIDISDYKDEEIAICGIGSDEKSISIEELKSLECKSITTESTSDKIGKVRATGVELGVLLEKYGITKDEIKSVRFYGVDKYDVPLLSDYIMEHDIYLAFGIDGKPLEADCVPCRIIIPESDSAYWIRMVNKIEFVMK